MPLSALPCQLVTFLTSLRLVTPKDNKRPQNFTLSHTKSTRPEAATKPRLYTFYPHLQNYTITTEYQLKKL